MRYMIGLAVAMLGFAMLTTSAFAQTAPSPTSMSIRTLGFMAGCWTTRKDAPEEYRECFTAPYAGIIQGSSQTVKDGKTVSFEFALMREKDGKITYTPFYNGKELSTFTATALGPDTVVFENPANDFPKKVIYHRNAEGTLSARITGAIDADKNNQEWIMIPQGM
ncbi:MAG: hypothetical protein JNM81_02155 [Rhodospirillaceae bacterium]|nr:hypothetical protein [Rhodospirillaceae bacterium]